nr:PhoX family phosphatase [Micromonospora sp. C95]
MSQDRRPLFRLPIRRVGRDPVTCQYRCGSACAHPAPNTSTNPYFGDLLRQNISRRNALMAGALVLQSGLVGLTLSASADSSSGPAPEAPGRLTFEPVPTNTRDAVVVPPGYQHAVVIAWGDPVLPDAPAWDPHRQTRDAQERQFGYNNDFLALLPLGDDGRRALLVGNHEYPNPELMFPGLTAMPTAEQVLVMLAAVGMFVVEVERVGSSGQWQLVRVGPRTYNRRITAMNTRFRLTGPAAGSDLLRTAADPAGRHVQGTMANCAGGVTPWDTVLSGEENFNGAFVGANAAPEAMRTALRRYGFDVENRGWPSAEIADERFDLAKHPNEANRFGWIVEVDPYDPRSTPRKHTALGRFKHEGAATAVSRHGHAVVYSGDDERFEYIYKFVSSGRVDRRGNAAARRQNLTLLESGTLYVAAFAPPTAAGLDQGGAATGAAPRARGRWIPLARNGRSLVAGMTVTEVLVNTRLAADRVGATKMDRPEDIEPDAATGRVYCALTNNSYRGAADNPLPDAANPRAVNRHGHILEIVEDGRDLAATAFSWSLPIICGDPADPSTYYGGYDKTAVSPMSSPDNLALDAAGNLWLATDSEYALGGNDGLFVTPVSGAEAGYVRQFLSAPIGAEVCGPVITEDRRTVIVAVQHPGEMSGSTADSPASRWPAGDLPKPGVVAVWRPDGQPIGT